MRHRLASILALASVAATAGVTRNAPLGRRWLLNHRPVRNADAGAAGGNSTATTPAQGGDDAAKAEASKAEAAKAKTFTQDEVNAFLAKEKRKVEERLLNAENLAKELETLRQEKQAAEEAKLSATQRAELERKREKENYEKKVADLDAVAKRERSARHDLLRSTRAAEAVSSIASKLLNDRLAPTVQREIASRLVVEQQADGTERLMVRMSDAAADLEPADAALPKLIDAEIAPVFFKAQGGSGAQHGGGNGGAAPWKNLSPDDRIAQGFTQRR